MRLGLGRSELDAAWTELMSSGFGYDFRHVGRRYRLQRTHSREDGVEGVMRKMNVNHFKVVEVGSDAAGKKGEAVAVYVSETFHPGWMKGTLTLREGVDATLETLIVLGVLGWRETMRRRAAYSGGAGNAGGG